VREEKSEIRNPKFETRNKLENRNSKESEQLTKKIMKIFGLNITRESKEQASNNRVALEGGALMTRSLDPATASWLRGQEPEAAGPVLTNAYQQVVWVYRAVNALAEQVANVPFLFSRGERGRENLVTSGPLLDFYARPHPQLSRFEYWELRVIWLMLRGECFRVPIYGGTQTSALSPGPSPNRIGRGEPDGSRNGNRRGGDTAPHLPDPVVRGPAKSSRRRLEKVLILDPAHFQHIVQDHQLVGWRYTGFGNSTPLASQIFLPEEVWYEKLPNPFDFWRGMPPLYSAAMAAKTDFAASAFMRGIIENNGDVGTMVRTEKQLAPEQADELIAALRNRKRRAGIADRPLLLQGAAEIIKPTLSSSDMQFLENRKFSRAEICAAFGVPEEILTATEHAKYDVMQGARQNFIENRVAPLCCRLEAAEDVVVKSLDPNAVGWFDLDSLPIMQQARRNRLMAARTGFEMGIPFNELNRVLDLGFKHLPWGDEGYVAAGMQKIGGQSSKSE
jgi:phage portal protein BeeE